MGKHRFSNKIKSMFGSYIDPDKDEELKGSYIEMEENYKKMVEILRDEDMNDRQKVVELLEDFHKHHQSVYERYDHITGELKAKVHSKKEKDSSSSSSSDSDSDDTYTKKGGKNGKLKANDILKEQLQAANAETDVLTEKLKVATDEKEVLHSDYQALLNKEQETEKMFEELKVEADRLREENSKLSEDNKDVNLKFEKFKVGREAEFNQQVEELNAVIARLEGENESFNSELTNLSQRLEATESVNKALSMKGSESADEIKTKDEKIEELATECSQLRENLANKEKELLSHTEMHASHKSDTETKIRGFEENFESLSSQKREIEIQKDEEIKFLTEDVNKKQEEIVSLCTHKLESENQLEKSSQEISGCLIQINSLIQELAGKTADEQKLVEEKEVYVTKVKDLEEEVKLLNGLKTASETEVGKKSREMAEYAVQIENFKVEVTKMTADQAKAVEEKEGYESKVKDLELKLESVSNSKSESEAQLEKKSVEISEHLIMIQGLKQELETKAKEYEKMVEEKEGFELKVKNLELQLESINNLKNESEIQLEKKGIKIAELVRLSQSLKEELETKSIEQAKTMEEKEGYVSKVKDLELYLESLNSLKIELETQLEKKGTEISELLSLSQSLKEDLERKSKDQEKTLEEKKVSESKVKDLELKLESLFTLKNETELQLEKNVLELSELSILIESLKEEVENKSKDQAKTVEEKESYTTKVDDLEKELSSVITCYKETEESVKTEITQKANEISGGMDSLTVKFEDDHRHILTRIYKIMNEIQVSKISLKNMCSEKDALKDKLAKTIQQLKALKTEKERLTNSVDQLEQKTLGKDKKIKELETVIHVKDEGLQDLGEEKREAIRQLCMLVDYQRDRYDRLQELLLKKTTSARR